MDEHSIQQDSFWNRVEELAESMCAIGEAREDLAAGRVQEIDEFAADFERRHGISR